MVMPSVLYAADSREAKANLRAIAGAAQWPIMVYNNPVTYKADLTPKDFQDLSDCKWIAAIKESTDNIRHVSAQQEMPGFRLEFINIEM